MRTIFLLRGAPSSGKSTWIKENKLEPYTLSADTIRLLYKSPVMNVKGNLVITQKNDGDVWSLLMKLLERRMQDGEFIIIDATHYKSSLLGKYKKLIEKYRYRTYVIDFTDLAKDECIRRNELRDEYKRVPEDVISKMYAVFEQDTEVANRFKVVSKKDAIKILHNAPIFDYNVYEKVFVFGDIHGCYAPLKSFFDKNPFNKNYSYIFVGDYIDRGIQNKEVLEFLISIMNNKNVLLLEGNHEHWGRLYSDKNYTQFCPSKEEKDTLTKYLSKSEFKNLYNNSIRSKDFMENTLPEIFDIDKKDLRQLFRKLGQFAYFKFGDTAYTICHGGIPNTPSIFMSTQEMIKGVGRYEELDDVYESWNKNTDSNDVLIHGHRNLFKIDTKVSDKIYNVCSDVEFGGNLRILEITKLHGIKIIEEPNTIFNKELKVSNSVVNIKEIKTENEIIKELFNNKLVKKKDLGDSIISCNFTRDVFHKRKWNNTTCTARGLFIDTDKDKVHTRSYSKFFNWGENEYVKSPVLKETFEFPVVAYKKENGFLGLVSYDYTNDDLFVASKSTNQGDFAEYFKTILYTYSVATIVGIKNICKAQDVTFIFEVVDIENDPHIIHYEESKIILLDIVHNDFNDEFYSYELLQNIGDLLKLPVKLKDFVFNNWEDLYSWKKEQNSNYEDRHEGWVLTDKNNFRVKIKTRYYGFWKMMRGVKERIQNNRQVRKTFATIHEIRVYNLMNAMSIEDLQNKNIIDIQKEYYNNEK